MLMNQPIPDHSLVLVQAPAYLPPLKAPMALTQGRPQCWEVQAPSSSPWAKTERCWPKYPTSSLLLWNDFTACPTVVQMPESRCSQR